MSSPVLTVCVKCGGALDEKRTEVRAQPLGRKVHYAHVALVCRQCHATYVGDDHARTNEAAWARAFGRALRDISGDDLRFVREQAKFAQPDLEATLGLGTNTVARWETGARPLPPYIATIIRLVALHPTALRELARLVAGGFIPSDREEAIERALGDPPVAPVREDASVPYGRLKAGPVLALAERPRAGRPRKRS